MIFFLETEHVGLHSINLPSPGVWGNVQVNFFQMSCLKNYFLFKQSSLTSLVASVGFDKFPR